MSRTVPDVEQEFAAAFARHQAGDFPVAEQMYRALLAHSPGHTPSLCNLGTILGRTGNPDGAADCYRKALAATPGYPDAHYNLGNLYRRAGRAAEAEGEYRACLSSNPNHVGATFNLGLVCSAAGDLVAAGACFQAYTQLAPNDPEGFMRLGDIYLRSGTPADGLAAFQKAAGLTPNDPRALYNLGLSLSACGRTAESLDMLGRALQLRPSYPEAHNAYGLALEVTGRKDDAQAHYWQATQINPQFADAWSNLGTNLGEQGRIDEAIEALRHAVALRPQASHIHSNLILQLNYTSRLTPVEVAREHRDWAARHAGQTPVRPPVPLPHDPNRRLRVGYLSADYRAHTVSGFIELLLRHHDRQRVEVFAYSNAQRQDETTEKLKGLADQWRPVAGLSDDQAAALVREDRIDVLIDLGGHTASNRLLLLARRPAPIQATLFGYPNTTGIEAVDYRITDAFSDPPGATESLSVETLLRLPEVAWAYRPPEAAPPVGSLPSATATEFVFGCLNNAAKISDACADAWATVLRAVPSSKLVLLAGQSVGGVRRLTDLFASAGVAPERIEMLPRLPVEQYFEAHNRIDVALDPFPYNGGVTTCDALWMGVPVLAPAGTTYVSRQGAGLMTRLGLPEFVAADPDGLTELAKRWSESRPELAEIRAGLRDRLAASVICDAKRYVGNLEAELRRVWQERLMASQNG